jgi:hypothetical protein
MKNLNNFSKQIFRGGLSLILTYILTTGFAPTLVFPQTLDAPPYGISKELWMQLQQKPAPNLNRNNLYLFQENNVFTNGSFENGDFGGWVTQDMNNPFFPLQVGGAGITPGFGFFTSDPTDGSFAALHGFDGDGPNTIRIAQDVTLPAEALFLEFDYRGAWNNGGSQNRLFMVNIEPSGGEIPLQTDTILTAASGTNVFDTGDLHGSVDVSGFANSAVRISFDWFVPENFTGPAFFQLDNIVVIPIGSGPQISFSPPNVDFGFIPVGNNSPPIPVTIRSLGTDTLTVSVISDPGVPFTLSNVPSLPAVIPPGELETFEVTFSPTSAGTFNATITISSNDLDDPTKDIALSGEGLVINPASPGVCYASTGNIDGGRLIAIDVNTGAGVLIGPTGLNAVPGLAINSSGDIFGVEAGTFDLYRIDANTGTAVFVASTGLASLPAIAFDGNDVLYGLGRDPVTFNFNLYTINTTTGVPTLIGPADFGEWRGMAFNPIDGTLWASTNWHEIYTIDPTTGTPTFIGNTGLLTGTPDIHFDSQGTLYGIAGGGGQISDLISIDQTSGAGTIIGSIGFSSVSGMATRIEPLVGPHIGVFPPIIDFGKVSVDSSSTPLTITIRSVGSDTLTVSVISDPGLPFTLSNVPFLPAIIPPGGTETFEVIFSPTSAGTFNATITVSSNDLDDPTKDIALSGEGLVINPGTPGVCFASTGNIDGGRLLTIDISTGAGTLVGPTGLDAVPGLAINSTGDIFGVEVGTFDLYRIDAATGTAVFAVSTGIPTAAIAFDGNDVLYALGVDIVASEWKLYTINPTTGMSTPVAPIELAGWRGMAFDPTDGTIWASTNGEEIYVIDPSTGISKLIGSTGMGVGTPDIHFDNSGNLYGATGGGTGSNNLISIDKTTAAGTIIGPIGFSSVSGMATRIEPLVGPHIGISPPIIDFGNVLVDSSSTPRIITIRSVGSDTLTVSVLSDPGAPYTLNNVPSLPAVIPPGGTETFEVIFSPTSAGTFNATITVSSNDLDDPTKDIALSGEGLVINPASSGVCYASTGNIDGGRLIAIDVNTGAGILIGPTGLNAVPGLAINSSGDMYGVEAGTFDLYRIDANTGTAVFVAGTGLGYLPAIAFDSTDVLYGLGIDPVTFNFNLYTINTATGIPTLIGPSDFGNWRGMAFNPIDGTLWASTSWEDIYTIDPSTGTPTFIGNTGLSTGTPDIHFNDRGTLYGVVGGGGQISNLISIDQTTGAGTIIGSIGFSSVSGMATRIEPLVGPHIRIFPSNVDFGYVVVDSSSTPRTITISSVGSDTLTVSVISDPGLLFTLSNVPSLPAIIPPGELEIFKVTFSPDSSGMFNATITVSSNDPDDPTKDISLSGEGLVINPALPGVCYASTGNVDGGRLLTIDINTGAGTLVGPSGLDAIPGLAINSNGEIFGVEAGTSDLYRIDANTGTAVFVAGTSLISLRAIAFDGNDVLYGLGVDPVTINSNLYTINTATGVPTIIGPSNFGFWRGMAFNPIDGTLWASMNGERIYMIDPNTGTPTFIGNTGLLTGTPDIHFDNQGILYGAAGGGRQFNILISIDQTTGAGTVIGSIGFSSVSGLSFYNKLVSVEDDLANIPSTFELSQNYPNPFNPATTIKYGLPHRVNVKLEVFNIVGQRVSVLVDEEQNAGYYRVIFHDASLASGVYLYRLRAGDFIVTKKFQLLK